MVALAIDLQGLDDQAIAGLEAIGRRSETTSQVDLRRVEGAAGHDQVPLAGVGTERGVHFIHQHFKALANARFLSRDQGRVPGA